MRRSLASRAIAFTSARVGPRKVSRSVSRTKGQASRKIGGGGISCNISGSVSIIKRKGEAGFPPPLWSPSSLRRFIRTRRNLDIHRLFGRSFGHRANRYERAAVGFGLKLDMALDLGEQGMIGAHADIKAGVPGRAALTRNDVAGNHMLATKGLDAKALALGITPVPR